MLKLYSLYHLNLAYSSIEESKRSEVIEKCFWPLIELAVDNDIPIAVEVPAYTLEVAADLDPKWIDHLSNAIAANKIELIGAGYSQMIFPLVPNEVNQWNLQIGKRLYKEIVNAHPQIWYINEQAYSSSCIESYNNVGAKAVVMEWNNPRSTHNQWPDEFRYHTQTLTDGQGKQIPVIWNDSISFQKFQRHAHNELNIHDYLHFISSHAPEEGWERFFCLYGNDAEIFDFRPGRFKTEARMSKESEWNRINKLYTLLLSEEGIDLCFPSAVLSEGESNDTRNIITLETPADPIPVKKQPKYNVTRWAVTGRDSIVLNSKCFSLYRMICQMDLNGVEKNTLDRFRKELCYFWSSDFRTHITEHRWSSLLDRIESVFAELKDLPVEDEPDSRLPVAAAGFKGTLHTRSREQTIIEQLIEKDRADWYSIQKGEKYLSVTTPLIDMKLDSKKGLSVQSLIFKEIDPRPLIGNIPHGYYNDITLSPDWFTMNTVLQVPGKPQLTDLTDVEMTLLAGTGMTGDFVTCSGRSRV